MGTSNNKWLTAELTPELATEAAEKYFRERGGPQPNWDIYRRIFGQLIPSLLNTDPALWRCYTN